MLAAPPVSVAARLSSVPAPNALTTAAWGSLVVDHGGVSSVWKPPRAHVQSMRSGEEVSAERRAAR